MRDETMDAERAQAVALLRPLAEEPVWASRVDPARAIAEGRRRRRSRRVTGAVTVGLLTAAAVTAAPAALGLVRAGAPDAGPTVAGPVATGSAAAHPRFGTPQAGPSRTIRVEPATPTTISRCTVERLPTGRHREAIVTGGDPSGRYLLGRSYPRDGSRYPMLIWRDGKLIHQTPLPGDDASLRDVNSSGVAVGYTYAPLRPYAVRDGEATVLPGVPAGQAFAVNEQGVIVGTRDRNGRAFPVRWASADQRAADLPLPKSARQGEASAIFDDGTVVGVLEDKDGSRYGYLWLPDGSTRRIDGPAEGRPYTEFQVRAAHNGWVVGVVGDAHYRYSVDADRFERLPSGVMYPDAVSVAGWVAASTPDNAGLVWTGRKTVELPVPKDFRSNPAPFTSVVSLSDNGRVVGGHTSEYGGPNTAVQWRCR